MCRFGDDDLTFCQKENKKKEKVAICIFTIEIREHACNCCRKDGHHYLNSLIKCSYFCKYVNE